MSEKTVAASINLLPANDILLHVYWHVPRLATGQVLQKWPTSGKSQPRPEHIYNKKIQSIASLATLNKLIIATVILKEYPSKCLRINSEIIHFAWHDLHIFELT